MVLIVQLGIDHKHFLIGISRSTASKTEAGQQHTRSSLCEIHPHKDTCNTSSNRDTYRVGTVCRYSLVIVQAACMTHKGLYYNTEYIQRVDHWQSVDSRCCFSPSVLFTALLMCWWVWTDFFRGRRRACCRSQHSKHIVAAAAAAVVAMLDACSRAQAAGICCWR